MASKYDPLRDHLAARRDVVVEMTLAEVDRLVDGGLPRSAYTYPAWWANEVGGTHVQRHAWLDAGRRTEGVDLAAGTVRFVHPQPPDPPGALSTRGAPIVMESADPD
jgi:hypothetical protein